MNLKRINSIDNLKGIAIIGVIFIHMESGLFSRHTEEIIDFFQTIFSSCVLAFFFASGLVVKKLKGLEQIKSFVVNRVRRLLIPCIVFSITYKLILISLTEMGYISVMEFPINISFQYFLKFIFNPVGPQFYFLIYLFIIGLFYAILDSLFSRRIIFLLSAISIICIYFFIKLPTTITGPSYNLIPFYFFSYCIGSFFKEKAYEIRSIKLELFLLIIWCISLHLTSDFNGVFIHFLVPIIVWVLFEKVEYLSTYFSKLSLGYYSSGIYVWHAPILMPVTVMVLTQFINIPSLLIISIMVVVILLCILLTVLTKKFKLLKLWRF